jgi:hypothetical protein
MQRIKLRVVHISKMMATIQSSKPLKNPSGLLKLVGVMTMGNITADLLI